MKYKQYGFSDIKYILENFEIEHKMTTIQFIKAHRNDEPVVEILTPLQRSEWSMYVDVYENLLQTMIPKNLQDNINALITDAFLAGFDISREGFNGEIAVHGDFDKELENYMETIKVDDRDKL